MAPLTGRALVAAMCLGQVGNLLPHVVVPAIMAQHLMPLWALNATQAGLMAGAYAFGYMLAVPVLTTLTDRIDARLILLAGSTVSGLATLMFGLIADGLVSAAIIWRIAQHHALHQQLFGRRRAVVSGRAARCRQRWMAGGVFGDGRRAAGHDRH